jgi:hypothetical protein
MNLSCNVIQDLLPLYHDNVCSAESSALVKEHLDECKTCKTLLAKMDENLEHPKTEREEIKPLQAIQSAWNKSKKKAFIKGTLIAALICAVLVGGYIGLTQWKIIPVPPDILEISEVSRLSNGSIAFHYLINDDKYLSLIKFTTTEDGSFYMTPMHSIIENKRITDIGPFNKYYSFYFQENDADGQYGVLIPSGVSAVYFGPVGNGILIWKEGMELPAASAKLQERFLGQTGYMQS